MAIWCVEVASRVACSFSVCNCASRAAASSCLASNSSTRVSATAIWSSRSLVLASAATLLSKADYRLVSRLVIRVFLDSQTPNTCSKRRTMSEKLKSFVSSLRILVEAPIVGLMGEVHVFNKNGRDKILSTRCESKTCSLICSLQFWFCFVPSTLTCMGSLE